MWIFPAAGDTAPTQFSNMLPKELKKNQLTAIGGYSHVQGSPSMTLNAWILMLDLDANVVREYHPKNKNNGVYILAISGKVNVAGTELLTRDGCAVTNADAIDVKALNDTEVLIIEVPMRSAPMNALPNN